MMQHCTSYRLAHSNVTIDGTERLDFSRYPYIPEIIDEDRRLITIVKGAQMGFTIGCIMKVLERAKEGKLRGIGYFFPTDGEVGDFAKARFSPMMLNNEKLWGQHVQDTDSAGLKEINKTFLYFRGMGQKGSGAAKRSTSKLKSIPLDMLILDERDEMDDGRVDAIYHRLDAARNPTTIVLSTPTLPGYGVDYDYTRSDQRVWMWKCGHCGDWTCLDTSYPDCIVELTNEDPYYRCMNKRCGKPLDRVRGQWVARKPEVKDHAGYWVSQTSSPTKSAAQIVLAAQNALETGRRREFENQTLARAFAEVDEEITPAQLEALLTDQQKPLRHEGPCAMGVDPGKPHWYEVSVRLTEKDSLVIARGRADTYEELSAIVKKFNVQSGVMDQGYDPSAVAAFCRAHPGWYGGLYVGGKKTDPDWDHAEHMVKMGRTRTLDEARNAIVSKSVQHVAKDQFWIDHFVPQMTNLKRATIEKEHTGEREGVWVITGGVKNDHLRHADAYCRQAEKRVGLSKSAMALRNRTSESMRSGDRPRSPWTM